MKLIICEKPSVGIAIASALGIETKKDGYMESEDFLVSWCIGHLESVLGCAPKRMHRHASK